MRALKDFIVLFLILPAVMAVIAMVSTVISGAAMLELTGTAGLKSGEAFSLAVKAWPLTAVAAFYEAVLPAILVLFVATDLKKRFPQKQVFCVAVAAVYFAASFASSLFDAVTDDYSSMNIGFGFGTAFSALSAVLVAAAFGPVSWRLIDRYAPAEASK